MQKPKREKRTLLLTFTLLLLSAAIFRPAKLAAQTVDHYETAVNASDTWRYWLGTVQPDPNWRKLNFQDTGWPQGPGGFGYADGDDSTIVSQTPSIFLRIKFNVSNPAKLALGLLNIDYDDGFVAYLNDVEIARSNLGSAVGDNPPANQPANESREAQMWQDRAPDNYIIPQQTLNALLTTGQNILAIQVHNESPTDSDLSALAWLSFGITDASTHFGPTPAWFAEPFLSSDLPLIVINTGGQTIPDDPRITAQMGVIDKGPGQRNHFTDPFNHYDGQISLEIRGSGSQTYPKKSYGFETQDSLGNNNDVPLLGMPAENDWILYAPYVDKSLLRNVLTYQNWARMGNYSPRTRFCELIIDNQYLGLYVLVEKIKRDKNRIDIPKLTPADVSGDNLTGGYVFKIDKTTGQGSPTWYSLINFSWYFIMHDPEESELASAQETYISTHVIGYEFNLNGGNFADPDDGYRSYLDVLSFIDYMALQEIGKTVDGYRSSAFFYKNRDSRGGKIHAGPPWDLNLAFGNADYCDAWKTEGYQYKFNSVCSGYTPAVPMWWDRFWDDSQFADEFRCRWENLRSGIWATNAVHAQIDSLANVIDEAKDRNFERWNVIGKDLGANYFIGQSYQEEIDYLKNWMTNRMQWLDSNFPGSAANCAAPGAADIRLTEINYNSDSTQDAGDWLELYNAGTAAVDISRWKLRDGNPANLFEFPVGTQIAAGAYLVVVKDSARFQGRHPGVSNFLGGFGWNLGNAGDGIQLYDAGYQPVFRMAYGDSSPWPLTPDGGGPTLEILDMNGNLSDPANWFAGCPGGSPGGPYVTPCPVAVAQPDPAFAVSVFPNPSRGVFEVAMENYAGEVSLSVSDLNGKEKFASKSNANRIAIDGSGWPPGIYLLEIQVGGEEIAVRKIIRR